MLKRTGRGLRVARLRVARLRVARLRVARLRGTLFCVLTLAAFSAACSASGESAEDATGETSRTVEECSGHAELCDRAFNDVAFAATHNSMSNDDDGWTAPNQNHGIERQLREGIRAFLIDVYDQEGTLTLCHTACILGSRPLDEVFDAYRTFLEENPGEILSLLIQNAVGAGEIHDALTDSGLDAYVYTHDPEAGWPTLREMIDADTRLLVTLESGGAPEDAIYNLWSLGWDTPYSFESTDDFSCDANRGSSDNDLFLVNHWLSTPLSSESNAREANSAEQLLPRVRECLAEAGQIPNFVAVDFYDVGVLLQAVDELNGI